MYIATDLVKFQVQ